MPRFAPLSVIPYFAHEPFLATIPGLFSELY
jgi:hypothetical protein